MSAIGLENLAKLLDLTPRRVTQLAAEGILVKSERGRYQLEASVRGYIRFLRNRSVPGDVVTTDDLQSSRAALFKSKAAIEEMKRQKIAGELVAADQIENVWRSVILTVRSRLLSIPTRIAQRIGMCQTDAERHKLLRSEIEEAMLELSRVNFDEESEPDEGGEEDFESGSVEGDNGDSATTGLDAEPMGGPEPDSFTGDFGGTGPLEDFEG